MRKTIAALAVCALCAGAATQTHRPPTRVGTAFDMVQLGPSTQAGSAFANVSPAVTGVLALEIHPNLSGSFPVPGEFYLIATVARTGGGGVMTGVLNTNNNPWTFTETTVADFGTLALTTGWTSATMSPDFLVVIAETTTTVKWSVRTARNVAFPAFVDTSLGNPSDVKLYRLEGGLEYVAWNSGVRIETQRIDRARHALGVDPRVNATLLTLVSSVFHPLGDTELLEDGQGDARAVIHTAETTVGVGRPWFNSRAIIGNTQPSLQYHTGPGDGTDFGHPGHMGGTTIYCLEAGGVSSLPKAIPIIANSGDNVPAGGGVVNLTAWLPFFDRQNPPTTPWVVTLLVGAPLAEVTIPGWRGKLAVGPQFVALPPRLWTSQAVAVDWAFPTPPVTAGSTLWVQTLVYDSAGQFDGDANGPDYFYLGNTAEVRFN